MAREGCEGRVGERGDVLSEVFWLSSLSIGAMDMLVRLQSDMPLGVIRREEHAGATGPYKPQAISDIGRAI